MWLFLGTEVLLFAGLFLGYTRLPDFYHQTFHEASRTLNLALGALNTVVLITSSFIGGAGYHAIKHGQAQAVRRPCWCSRSSARCAFLVIKASSTSTSSPRARCRGSSTLPRGDGRRAPTSSTRSTS